MRFCTIWKPILGLLRSKPTKDRKPGTATAVSRLTGSAGSFSDGLTRAGSGRFVLTKFNLSTCGSQTNGENLGRRSSCAAFLLASLPS